MQMNYGIVFSGEKFKSFKVDILILQKNTEIRCFKMSLIMSYFVLL